MPVFPFILICSVIQIGVFELVSVAVLRQRINLSNSLSAVANEKLTFEEIRGETRSLHLDKANSGAVFQVIN